MEMAAPERTDSKSGAVASPNRLSTNYLKEENAIL